MRALALLITTGCISIPEYRAAPNDADPTGKATVRVRARDRDGAPFAGARVYFGTNAAVLTDEAGVASGPVAPDTQVFVVQNQEVIAVAGVQAGDEIQIGYPASSRPNVSSFAVTPPSSTPHPKLEAWTQCGRGSNEELPFRISHNPPCGTRVDVLFTARDSDFGPIEKLELVTNHDPTTNLDASMKMLTFGSKVPLDWTITPGHFESLASVLQRPLYGGRVLADNLYTAGNIQPLTGTSVRTPLQTHGVLLGPTAVTELLARFNVAGSTTAQIVVARFAGNPNMLALAATSAVLPTPIGTPVFEPTRISWPHLSAAPAQLVVIDIVTQIPPLRRWRFIAPAPDDGIFKVPAFPPDLADELLPTSNIQIFVRLYRFATHDYAAVKASADADHQNQSFNTTLNTMHYALSEGGINVP